MCTLKQFGMFEYLSLIFQSQKILGNRTRSPEFEDEEFKIPILVLNSVVNPFVYAFLKRDINNEFKKMTYVVTFKRDK